jgi:hypothetical protein
LRAAGSRHRALIAGMAVVVAGFLVYGVATGAELAVPYVVIVTAGAVVVAAVEPPDGFGRVVLAGLSLWAVGHLAGGIVGIGDDRTLYNAVLPGGLHFDNAVHFVGFGTAGLAWWEATRPWLPATAGRPVGVWVAVWLAGMGVGALNEVLEFVFTLLVEDTNVGGYHNTGRDLIANMLGAAVAATIAAVRHRRAHQPAGAGAGAGAPVRARQPPTGMPST